MCVYQYTCFFLFCFSLQASGLQIRRIHSFFRMLQGRKIFEGKHGPELHVERNFVQNVA